MQSVFFPALAGEIAAISKRVHFVLPAVPTIHFGTVSLFAQDGVIVRYIHSYIMQNDELATRWDVFVVPGE